MKRLLAILYTFLSVVVLSSTALSAMQQPANVSYEDALAEVEAAMESLNMERLSKARAIYAAVKAIRDREQDQIKLDNAAVCGNKQWMEKCLAKGAGINAFDEYGNTPLIWACCKDEGGDMEIHGLQRPKAQKIALLLEKGANPNLVDREKGRTPLRWLLRLHENSPVKSDVKKLTTAELLPCFFLLMCSGANPKIKDIHGQDVFDWIEIQKFTPEERALVRQVLSMDKETTKSERTKLLLDIYFFQCKAFEEHVASRDKNPEPLDLEHIVLWKIYKAGAIKKSYVAKKERLPFDRFAYSIVFNDIYQKYIS